MMMMKKTFALLGLLLGSSVAFTPTENIKTPGSILEATSAPHFATATTTDVGVDTPIVPGGALTVPAGGRRVVPPGTLSVYDEEKTGSYMPDAQRQRRAVGLPEVHAQQYALGVSCFNNDASLSRGFSHK